MNAIDENPAEEGKDFLEVTKESLPVLIQSLHKKLDKNLKLR